MANSGMQQEKVLWQKSTLSNAGGGCVMVADLGVALRDSKDPKGAQLHFTRLEFAAFVGGIRSGEFDHVLTVVA
jgi:hypothetical protein